MHKVLIANRGEVALRIVRACREMDLHTVAVYSTADESALHVRRADEAICVGKPSARHSYLNIDALLDAARRSGADAIHPGYGFLAENPHFARRCRDAGLVWVGPSPEAIEALGDKAAARRLATDAGVPVVPGTDRTVAVDETASVAARIGYPLMIKAAGGGGGRGIRIVRQPDELAGSVVEASREAQAAFGNSDFYLEKLIERPRHVEIQLLGDASGNVLHLYERECSLQRRRQKLLEEAPSPALDASTREAIAQAAVSLARAAGYTNAGTAEFLIDPDGAFYFIEMNTRMQVEHPVTEMTTGVDLVKQQLLAAAGEPSGLTQEAITQSGAAIEFRINAEDPDDDFRPDPGRIDGLEVPGGPGVRVDSALYDGYAVPPYYDSLLAKLIVWGQDRDEALARGRRALEEFTIGGIATTKAFHLRMLADDGFRRGDYHTDYLAERGLA
jgi:acetyl-CoA carboxylase, biotin carboxylase subunit